MPVAESVIGVHARVVVAVRTNQISDVRILVCATLSSMGQVVLVETAPWPSNQRAAMAEVQIGPTKALGSL